ncbi:NADH-quinone oxidoreductase subunit C [Wenjunlia tyrosinilytica]|uniref:NADH:ubiquinone oxidoreductase 30kDa subunit domain-containing protein n=1 Tax=Wenjunlia tyrosinilytica TaxID=1544741 RepID=A0A918DU02_9ACTN|nr:NADH-quinone oxidoreductase subunit C [Wenjunlia tyrosinilytica]GGO83802.1 hypothetical protein GCM10012280_13770 [Wenjunlia tyrosinilytica]
MTYRSFEQLADEAGVTAVFGEGATAAEAYELMTVDVPAASWVAALTAARDVLGCTYFDWLSAVDEPGQGFHIAAHVAAVGNPVRRLLVRTLVPHDAPSLPSAVEVYAGAAWHERETHEMFGVDFPGHPHLVPLLLPEGFEGHPLRKEFVLAARVVKAWPGAKEPGESDHGGPKRRQMLPPGVPDPNEWGPMKGKLAPEPARERPARGARAAGAAADRPRRTRSVGEGSATQSAPRRTTPDAPWQKPGEGKEPEPGPGPGKAPEPGKESAKAAEPSEAAQPGTQAEPAEAAAPRTAAEPGPTAGTAKAAESATAAEPTPTPAPHAEKAEQPKPTGEPAATEAAKSAGPAGEPAPAPTAAAEAAELASPPEATAPPSADTVTDAAEAPSPEPPAQPGPATGQEPGADPQQQPDTRAPQGDAPQEEDT